MTELAIISTIIGIIAGAIAILEKAFGVFGGRKRRHKKIFKDEFGKWVDSGFEYTMNHEKFKLLAEFLKNGEFTDEELAFWLRVAVQHGDNHLVYLVEKNKNNKGAIKHLFGAVAGHGVRVGWRAEYALSQMNRESVMDFINNLPDEAKNQDSMKASINRIENDTLKNFLLEQEKSGNQKMSQYAAQVLRQIEHAYLTSARSM